MSKTHLMMGAVLATISLVAQGATGPQGAILVVPDEYETVQAAVDAAASGDTILIRRGFYAENVHVEAKDLSITSSNPSDPLVVAQTVLSARGLGTPLTIDNGSEVEVAGITVADGLSSSGGGISAQHSVLSLDRCVIAANHCTADGGGVYAYDAEVHMDNCHIVGNETPDDGGGAFLWRSNVTLVDVSFRSNRASDRGGALVIRDSEAVLRGVEIRDSSGAFEAGGLFFNNSVFECVDLDIHGNIGTHGAGVSLYESEGVFLGSRIYANHALERAGALFATRSPASFVDCEFAGNTAQYEGGALYLTEWFYEDETTIRLERCRIVENITIEGSGGAMSLAAGVQLELLGTLIRGNEARDRGGAIHCKEGTLNARNTVIAGNSAAIGGGLVLEPETHGRLDFCTIAENNADDVGTQVHTGLSAACLIDNSIVMRGTGDSPPLAGEGTIEVNYSLVQGGWPGGQGNIDADDAGFTPFPVGPGFEYTLLPASIAIDAADPLLEDQIKWPEIYRNGRRADMGAYGGPTDRVWLGP